MSSLTGLLPEELQNVLDLPKKYQAEQLFLAINQGVTNPGDITTFSKQLRETISEKFSIYSSVQKELFEDPDGTRKITIELSDKKVIEAVLLSDGEGRKTACLSTQAGCAMACAFCRTGTMGLLRNLSAEEISEQFMMLQNAFGNITHIVFMGMGEPLQNLNNLRRSITWLSHSKGQNIGLRRITISTCGLTEALNDLVQNGPKTRIAFSLTSAIPELRKQLMPVTKNNPLNEIKTLFKRYQNNGGKRITMEYVLLKGINDRAEDIQALKQYCSGLHYIINLIPWNKADELDFTPPEEKDVQHFIKMADKAHLNITRRYRKGTSINGACGQLAVPLNKI